MEKIKSKDKRFVCDFIDKSFINTIMMMYANGVAIEDIYKYVGIPPGCINEIIDNYNDCLNMEE